jgi:hypothetical protein
MNIDSPNGKSLEITCDFMENDLLKLLPNRRFNGRKRVWSAPALSRNVEYLLQHCPRADWTPKAKALAESVMSSVRVPAPAPIPANFRFKTEPLAKQLEAVSLFHNRDVGAWFMGTGTGKSKCLIDLSAIKYTRDEINASVIFCPATVKLPWMKVELVKHCSVPYEVYVHDGDDKKFEAFLLLRTSSLKFLFISTEALSVGPCKKLVAMIKRFMLAHRCFAGVDEGHDIKNHKSIRTEHAIELSKFARHKLIMTGTPIDEGIMDVFPYFEFLNPNILGFGDYYSFRARYAIMGGYEDKKIVSYQNMDELMGLIKPHVFQCSKDEMKDMPPKMYQRRYIKMTPAQKKLYKELSREHTITYGEDIEHDVENSLEKMMLQQYIASGYFSYNKTIPDMLGEEGEELIEREVQVIEEYPPKVKEAIKWVSELPKNCSIIFWSRWKRESQCLVDKLSEIYGADQVLHLKGGMGAAKKDEMREKFEAKQARFFVAHPASGGVGLTLIAATFVGYLSNTFRYLHRQQSEDRCHRIGQDNAVTYMDFIMEDTVDEQVLEAIAMKHNVATWVDTTLRKRKHNVPADQAV